MRTFILLTLLVLTTQAQLLGAVMPISLHDVPHSFISLPAEVSWEASGLINRAVSRVEGLADEQPTINYNSIEIATGYVLDISAQLEKASNVRINVTITRDAETERLNSEAGLVPYDGGAAASQGEMGWHRWMAPPRIHDFTLQGPMKVALVGEHSGFSLRAPHLIDVDGVIDAIMLQEGIALNITDAAELRLRSALGVKVVTLTNGDVRLEWDPQTTPRIDIHGLRQGFTSATRTRVKRVGAHEITLYGQHSEALPSQMTFDQSSPVARALNLLESAGHGKLKRIHSARLIPVTLLQFNAETKDEKGRSVTWNVRVSRDATEFESIQSVEKTTPAEPIAAVTIAQGLFQNGTWIQALNDYRAARQ